MTASHLFFCRNYFVPRRGFLRKTIIGNLMFGYKGSPPGAFLGRGEGKSKKGWPLSPRDRDLQGFQRRDG